MGVQEDFQPNARWLWEVRHFVKQALVGAPFLDDIVLVASELATNVVRHADTVFTVRVITDDERVRLEVSDSSSVIPAFEEITESQRGLRLIETVSERWGIDLLEDGKTIWAEFRAE